ncbi:aminoacyl-histidine dipeptidase [Neiella marina]|uniref:Aminoacyl-histidine dipeptidase n=1 Tax=Neiella holothuriorum TaxID=2870530 RepID=A0ABS7ECD5_9GAMM|nr:aminoacyl-histidine dipeptidase [Neiella holothuriorum]MBW8189623.1 aminoacyl-histidine dipeptidase [Neiella holothuriorum]
MANLSTLQPSALWQFFESICSIPHPSKHEEALATWICQWATEQKLDWQRDEVGNVIIRKAAAAGCEHLQTVVLQAHIDMVPQKGVSSSHNFETDPIETVIDGDWLKANDTTLGADNGIGMASCLAVLAADDIAHGPLEVLLTIDEEAGMTGAFGLQSGVLTGTILINTDSEQEGEIYMGCAGGIDANISFPITREPAQLPHAATITIGGLRGGHSGVDIHLGRGNANKLLARTLFALQQQGDIELVSFNGGSLRNAIPRDANAIVRCADLAALQQQLTTLEAIFRNELVVSEPNLSITLTETDDQQAVLNQASYTTFIQAMMATANGVMAMSQQIDGVTETSSNLGVVTTADDHIKVLCLIRSLIDSARLHTEQAISSTWLLAGASVEMSGCYPGWAPNPDSPVMGLVRQVYQQHFDDEPKIMVIHAGLECGLFKTSYPDLDMVSIGPTIKFPHSPDEKVQISSVANYWTLLVELLKAIPAK